MAKKSPFYTSGKFYKGNIHLHSIMSDGCLEAEELIANYKEKGYDFISFTDHEIFSDYSNMNTPDFIIIPGYEGSFRRTEEEWREYHLIALPGPKQLREKATKPAYSHHERVPVPQLNGKESIQKVIDECRERGYMVMLNHPGWSTIEYDDVIGLKGLFAMEVYNFCGEVQENMGRSEMFWDALLRRGMRLWGTATDDNHNEVPLDDPMNDSFGGWVCVKAEALTEEAICQALHDGSFYSSQGPEIYDFYVEDNTVHIKCSPVNKIYCRDSRRKASAKLAPQGENSVTEFTFELTKEKDYVRAECIDADGKIAYTNPIFL